MVLPTTPAYSQPSASTVHSASPFDSKGNVICVCGQIAQELTSHTVANPNRVFYKCSKPKDQKCEKFFKWKDELRTSNSQSSKPLDAGPGVPGPSQQTERDLGSLSPRKRFRSQSPEPSTPRGKRTAGSQEWYPSSPITPSSSQVREVPGSQSRRDRLRMEIEASQSRSSQTIDSERGHEYSLSPPTAREARAGSSTDALVIDDAHTAPEPAVTDADIVRPHTPRAGERASNRITATHGMLLTPETPIRILRTEANGTPSHLQVRFRDSPETATRHIVDAGLPDEPAADLEPLTADEIESFVQRLSALPNYIKQLERVRDSSRKSIEYKNRRIEQLEKERKELQAQVEELEALICPKRNGSEPLT